MMGSSVELMNASISISILEREAFGSWTEKIMNSIIGRGSGKGSGRLSSGVCWLAKNASLGVEAPPNNLAPSQSNESFLHKQQIHLQMKINKLYLKYEIAHGNGWLGPFVAAIMQKTHLLVFICKLKDSLFSQFIYPGSLAGLRGLQESWQPSSSDFPVS